MPPFWNTFFHRWPHVPLVRWHHSRLDLKCIFFPYAKTTNYLSASLLLLCSLLISVERNSAAKLPSLSSSEISSLPLCNEPELSSSAWLAVGETAVFICECVDCLPSDELSQPTDDEKIDVRWYKVLSDDPKPGSDQPGDLLRIENDDQCEIKTDFEKVPTSYLVLKEITIASAGRYVCVVWVGSAKTEAYYHLQILEGNLCLQGMRKLDVHAVTCLGLSWGRNEAFDLTALNQSDENYKK